MVRSHLIRIVASCALILILAGGAPAAGESEDETILRLRSEKKSGAVVQWLPRGDLFRPYIADPHRTAFALMPTYVSENNIPNTGNRLGLRIGANFGLVRRTPKDAPSGQGWQVSFAAGFEGIFDAEDSLDSIGWDGEFGWYFNWARPKGWIYRFGWQHNSSHLGDEYVEDNGRERLNYTRYEYLAAVSKQFTPRWRAYGEVAFGVNPANPEIQEAWRFQAGGDYERTEALFGGKFGWYLALDLQTMQEQDWKVDTSVQGGISLPVGTRMHRVGIQVYDGRMPIAEFFEVRETYVTLGVWIDFGYLRPGERN